MFHVSERFGFSLPASRRFAVSDTACCSFLTLQRYYISIAVYEYISKIILSIFCLLCLARSFGHLVICQNRKLTVKIRHYNINIYLYIVSNDRVPEIDFDQMTLTK